MEKQTYYIVGVHHVDLAWKSSEQEYAEMLEVMAVRLLDLLEHEPEFTFVLEQAYHYRALQKSRPDLIQRLKQYIQEGRLEFMGGMASTMETNIPNGECFVRNQLLGLQWVQEYFGIEVKTGWLMDTFGINAQVPQILRQFGIRHLMANRLGGNKYNDVFLVRGLDGSEALVAGRDVYSAYIKPGHVLLCFADSWEKVDKMFAEIPTGKDPVMVIPMTENEYLVNSRAISLVKQKRLADPDTRYVFSVPSEFFHALEESGGSWPVENGDLNPEFTATFSQRIGIRTRNRAVENWLIDAEKWSVLLGKEHPKAALEDAWWKLSFVHFHDVFTGSHPSYVYDAVMDYLSDAESTAAALLQSAVAAVSSNDSPADYTVFNSLPFAREDVVELKDVPGGFRAVLCDGEELPCETVGERLRVRMKLPACGAASLQMIEGGHAANAVSVKPRASIENEYIFLECDRYGGIKRLVWKPTGKVLIENADDFLVVQMDEGSFQIEQPTGSEVAVCAGSIDEIETEDTSVCNRMRIRGAFPALPWAATDNHLKWQMEFSLLPDKPLLYCKIRLNWKGEMSRIRLKLVTRLTASEGYYEVPFGVVKRNPYAPRGTARGEWPAHRFALIQERDYGLALINTGVPGVEIAGGTLWTTLLRAPKSKYAGMAPDETSSQHGEHEFTFALLPYAGRWEDSDAVRFAQEMNSPLLPVSTQNSVLAIPSLMRLEPANLVLSAIKYAEDSSGDMIVRFYETTGKTTAGTLWVRNARNVWRSDLKERILEALDCQNGSVAVQTAPFEIVTIRIKTLNGRELL